MSRQRICAMMQELGPDQRLTIPRYDLERAYPPRGNSIADVLLAMNGNRPEPVQSSMDRLREDASEYGCRVIENFEDGSATVERVTQTCQTCRGRGLVFEAPSVSLEELASLALRAADAPTHTTHVQEVACPACNGTGKVGDDPKRERHGDYRDVDAWIRAKYGA